MTTATPWPWFGGGVGPNLVRRLAYLDHGLLIVAQLLTRSGNHRRVDDLPALRQIAAGFQPRVEQCKELVDRARLSAPTTMRVFIPLTIRKRTGRPKIVPPTDMMPDTSGVDPHVLKAIAKAWSWRRKLESGEVATIEDVARAENVTPAFIRRTLKLAYLSPAVLENLLIARASPAASLKDISAAVDMPWAEQVAAVFGSN